MIASLPLVAQKELSDFVEALKLRYQDNDTPVPASRDNTEAVEAIESLKQVREKIIQEDKRISREEILQRRDEGRKCVLG